MLRLSRAVLPALTLWSVLAGNARAESVAAPHVWISDVSVEEGQEGDKSFTATVQMHGWHGPVAVDVAAIPGTADAADYQFTTTRLTLTPGAAPVMVSGTIRGDASFEGDEWFDLRAMGTGQYPYFVASSGGRITIRDDDQARASRLTIDGASVPEGDQGTTMVAVPVTLAPAADHPVLVDYAFIAPQGASQQGTLQFAPGQTQQTVSVPVVGDTYWESDERVMVQLRNARRALIATDRGELLVRNDDAPSVVTLADVTVAEGQEGVTPVVLTFTYDRPTPPQTKLWVRTDNGLAAAGSDFKAIGETFYPPPGATTFTVTLELLGDIAPECDEGLTLRFAGVYTGDDTQKTARLTITNDDGPRRVSSACPDPFTPDPNAPAQPQPKPADWPPDGGAGGTGGGTGTTDAAAETTTETAGPKDPGGACSYAPGRANRAQAPAGLVVMILLGWLLTRAAGTGRSPARRHQFGRRG